jgi:hypothetical protein
VGECPRLPKLRPGHQSLRVGHESNHDRNCDLSELRLVRPDRNTSCRSSASEEGYFSPIIALRRYGERQLLVLLVRHFPHESSDKFARDL